jgi:hypothetical protein
MTTESKSFAAEVWQKLSAIDVTPYVEKKGAHDYVGWANGWTLLMNEYPDSSFEFHNTVNLSNGTCEVRCSVNVCRGPRMMVLDPEAEVPEFREMPPQSITRSMWLPVMNHKNMAISDPTSRDLNDAKMRCLVKCLALFGLGIGVYGGELGVSETQVDEPATELQLVELQDFAEADKIPPEALAWCEKKNWMLTEKEAARLIKKVKAND